MAAHRRLPRRGRGRHHVRRLPLQPGALTGVDALTTFTDRREATHGRRLLDVSGIGQSKVSYHLRVLGEAGLVREEQRGKWSFYAIDGEAAAQAFEAFKNLLRV